MLDDGSVGAGEDAGVHAADWVGTGLKLGHRPDAEGDAGRAGSPSSGDSAVDDGLGGAAGRAGEVEGLLDLEAVAGRQLVQHY